MKPNQRLCPSVGPSVSYPYLEKREFNSRQFQSIQENSCHLYWPGIGLVLKLIKRTNDCTPSSPG